MKARILSTVAVVGMVVGMASAAQAGFPSAGSLGRSAGNAVQDAATKAVKGAAMQPRTACKCEAGTVNAECAAKLSGEIGGKQMIGGAVGENHSYWIKCEVFDKTKEMANNCATSLETMLSKVGASRTNVSGMVGAGRPSQCSVQLY